MNRWKRSAVIWIGLLCLLIGCAAPTPAPSSQPMSPLEPRAPAAPKRIVTAIRGAPSSLAQNRLFPPGSSGSVPGVDALEELVHAGAAHWDGGGNLVPQLAEAAPTAENGLWKVEPDGRMETIWRIKPTARWHDGTPVTAGDFLFAAAVEQDKDTGIPRNPAYDLVERIEAPDERTVTVTWKRPFIEADSIFTYRLALPLPRHLLETAFQGDKEAFLGHAAWSREFVGAGPYRVREWVPDSHVIVEAYEAYVLGRPKIDVIEVKFIPDPTTLMANVLAGVELTIGRALSFDQGLQMREQWREGTIATRLGAALPAMPQFINPNPPVVADLRFRRALLHAIDRQEIVDSLLAGEAAIAHTFVSPTEPGYAVIEPQVVKYDFDRARAIRMLEELGYARGADGMFVDASNQKLTVQIYTAAQNDRNPKVTGAVAGYWQQVGVTVEQAIIPIQRFQDVEYRAQFPAFEITSTAGGISSRDIIRYRSSSTPLPENQFRARGNGSRYRNPELDAFLDRYLTTIPMQPRLDALAGLVHHQTENVTMLPLFYDGNVTMVGNRLRNVSGRGDRYSETWNAHEWDLKA